MGACVALGKTKRISKTCVVVCLQDDDQEDMVDLVDPHNPLESGNVPFPVCPEAV